MKTFTLVVKALLSVVFLVVGWVAYDYATKFLDRVMRLVYQTAPAGGKTQLLLCSHWNQAISWGEWTIIALVAIMVIIILRIVWRW